MEFASYGLEVYTSEVDDHGIDFVAKKTNGKFIELQVKAVRQSNYVYMQKTKWNIFIPNVYLILLIFEDGKLPDVYLIPSVAWQSPNELLCDKDYDGLKSKPEYGVNLSKKNMPLLEKYRLEKMIQELSV
ncbi:MAG: DUF4365 domain-containing protein [Clostridia bacterium]|nr:DUF4365 domain-containing protein [Clostridia bacterium]